MGVRAISSFVSEIAAARRLRANCVGHCAYGVGFDCRCAAGVKTNRVAICIRAPTGRRRPGLRCPLRGPNAAAPQLSEVTHLALGQRGVSPRPSAHPGAR